MRAVDVIRAKRDGRPLPAPAIEAFVRGATDGSWPDYQISALLMAIVLRGMTDEETAVLTRAMAASGTRVDLTSLPGVKVGKHSTGGVGDKVSIVLAPLAAACGVVVPKMSGRGLGHTGGTLDKLESIPGFRTSLSLDEFRRALAEVGCAIISQTADVAPADKKLYALRDVTGTIESLPLICASVMSKKIAEGSDALVLDVKCGRGAFMKTLDEAMSLARALVAIGTASGIRTEALVTRMDAPLGTAVGNALEIRECVALVTGSGSRDLRDLVERLAGRMLVLSGTATDETAAAARVRHALDSGAAAEKLRAMIASQGGDAGVVDAPERLPVARTRRTITAERSGFVTALDAEQIGRAAVLLGAGRARKDDPIDPAAGVLVLRQPGDPVAAGDGVLELHLDLAPTGEDAERLARGAVTIGDAPPALGPLALAWVHGGGEQLFALNG
jgi:pyrimidine-nucleoside phosphorylase